MSLSVSRAFSLDVLDAFRGDPGQLLWNELSRMREELPGADVLVLRLEAVT